MPKNPPEGMSRITPYIFYNDITAALQWLEKVFLFEKSFEMPNPQGTIVHAEMRFKDGLVMLGIPCDQREGKSPSDIGSVSQSLYIYVDNVDDHYQHTKSFVTKEIAEPVDMFWGDRMYTVSDLEGHYWTFAQHIKDVAPEDMKPTF